MKPYSRAFLKRDILASAKKFMPSRALEGRNLRLDSILVLAPLGLLEFKRLAFLAAGHGKPQFKGQLHYANTWMSIEAFKERLTNLGYSVRAHRRKGA